MLVIEDEPTLARNVCDALRLAGHEATSCPSGEEGLQLAEASPPDVVILDLRLPGIDGLEVLRELRTRGNSASVVMMTAHGAIDTAVEAMKTGAADFLQKPLELTELELVVSRVLAQRKVHAQLEYFRRRERSEGALDQIIGQSAPMMRVRQFIERLATTPALASDVPPSVLITGETGTGKDLIARAIHYAGPRSEGPFVHVNCTALPDHLVEAELFGHVKGAFTDARGDKRGLLESADGGTVFLDEIGHMKAPLQAKLLTTLEHRTVRPVGGTKERPIKIHVIAATNRNLESAIEASEFREDLYHRLRVLSIPMPPLRDRGEDTTLLANHFLHMYAVRFGLPVERFTRDAIKLLQRYEWPGNVRELMHVVESAVLMSDSLAIHPDQLNIRPKDENAELQIGVAGGQTINVDFSKNPPKLDEIENEIINAALTYTRHNLSKAARILGISRDAIRYRLEKFEREQETDV